MISTTVQFRLEERVNVYQKSGKEWALYATLGEHSSWTLTTWEKKPSDEAVDAAKKMILRSFEFYHKHLQIPRFEMEIIEEKTKGEKS